MINWIVVLIAIVWVYALSVLKRAKLDFWYFTVGSAGLFIIAIVTLQPVLLMPMQNAIAAVSGLFGELTGTYSSYFEKGLLFIAHGTTSISLYIDFECSGIIETFAFLSLLWFFPAYQFYEKIAVSIVGVFGIFLANVLRIFFICQMIYWGGQDMYFFAHSFVGRLVFYACTIALYFYVFTRAQVVRQKVGAFRYDNHQ